MLGQIYGRVQIYDQELRGGRQLVDTPLINPQDNRMVPNTFTGATVVSLPDKDRSYDYAAGYLWDVKQRDSNSFISMSDALAGANVETRGATFGMLRYRPFSGLSTVIMDYYVQDFVNTGFAQVEYNFQRPKEVPNWIIGANVIDQRSVGSDLLTGSSFQTYQASAKVQMTYAGWTFFVAGSSTGDKSKIFSPFGTKPNYTDMQQVSFDNANEKAIGGSAAYDFGYAFGKYGLSGFSAGAWYTQGSEAINPTTSLGIPDRKELDLWIQYRPTEGPAERFPPEDAIFGSLAARQYAQCSTRISFHHRLHRAFPPPAKLVRLRRRTRQDSYVKDYGKASKGDTPYACIIETRRKMAPMQPSWRPDKDMPTGKVATSTIFSRSFRRVSFKVGNQH